MKILFTGTSSFTGAWFVHGLVRAGHDVVAVTRRSIAEYSDLRKARVERLTAGALVRWECPTGSGAFHRVIEESDEFDVLCLHSADVGDYRRPDFDYRAAFVANTEGLDRTLALLAQRRCRAVVLTGSVFEAGEGAGERPLRAFSPYGLSKSLTSMAVEFCCQAAEMPCAKFVISNPFGPMEEPRFVRYLVHAWLDGRVPEVKAPRYVRDNIHVSLLTQCYVGFVESVAGDRRSGRRRCPSGYIESQGAFARRVAEALQPRLGVPCPVHLAEHTRFEEPRIRVNLEPAEVLAPEWHEGTAWQALADFYLDSRGGTR